jgi:hypothetical protein
LEALGDLLPWSFCLVTNRNRGVGRCDHNPDWFLGWGERKEQADPSTPLKYASLRMTDLWWTITASSIPCFNSYCAPGVGNYLQSAEKKNAGCGDFFSGFALFFVQN